MPHPRNDNKHSINDIQATEKGYSIPFVIGCFACIGFEDSMGGGLSNQDHYKMQKAVEWKLEEPEEGKESES